MQTEDAYSSGHLVLSHFGTCMCSNDESNLSRTCLVSGLLNFEHPSVLLFCLYSKVYSWPDSWRWMMANLPAFKDHQGCDRRHNSPSLHQLHRMSSSWVISVSGGLLIGYKYDESGHNVYKNLLKKKKYIKTGFWF